MSRSNPTGELNNIVERYTVGTRTGSNIASHGGSRSTHVGKSTGITRLPCLSLLLLLLLTHDIGLDGTADVEAYVAHLQCQRVSW